MLGEQNEDGFAYMGSMVFSYDDGDWVFDSTPFVGGRIRKSGSSFVADRYATDHLGSVRAVVRSGQVTERNDYYPYGGRHANSALTTDATNRWRFSGKEIQTTASVNLLDFGARMYDDRLCRWTTQDPLAEKYYGFSPYVYCAGEPVGFVDPDGCIVKPKSDDALDMVRNTLSKRDREFVKLNDEGVLDVALLQTHKSNSDNYNSLLLLAESPTNIEVFLGNEFEFKDNTGALGLNNMQYLGVDEYFVGNNEGKGVGTTTGEVGFLGKTLFPGDKAQENSTDQTIRIIINSGLSEQGRAETFAHEGYGHAYMFVKTLYNYSASTHSFARGGIDTNGILYTQINRAIN